LTVFGPGSKTATLTRNLESMAEAKIEIKAGGAEFSASGDQQWVSDQLDKFFENASKLASIRPESEDGAEDDRRASGKSDTATPKKTLATHLKEKGATSNQIKKFLQTAIWLGKTKGKDRLTTREVSDALKAAHQSRLGNPADCLNQNVTKGYCEKDGKEFFVTEEGKNS
jgi:hypothetical protein